MTITWQVEHASEPSHAPAITSSKKFNIGKRKLEMQTDTNQQKHLMSIKNVAHKKDRDVSIMRKVTQNSSKNEKIYENQQRKR
jgi:hypothetical protein